jgi:hypothetical protein
VIVNPGLEVGLEDVVNQGKIENAPGLSLSPKRRKIKAKKMRRIVERRGVEERVVRRRAKESVVMRGRVDLVVGAGGIETLNLL